jgi:hypothetical protein
LTSRPSLTRGHERPGTAKSPARQGRARVAGGPNRNPKSGKNGGQNCPPGEKSPEIRKAEKALTKTGRDAKRPQIPERREENGPRGKKRQIPENGGQNTPPDVKSPEIRNAEKALTKTGRDAKRPQIPERREENGPRGKKRQISQNGGQNTNPAPALLSAHARK